MVSLAHQSINRRIFSRKPPRYQCTTCGTTFVARKGTVFEGLRTAQETVTLVLTLLAHGCPLQAIVVAFGFDERTVADWQQRAGQHSERNPTSFFAVCKITMSRL